jgi:hypothetical protein
MVVPINDYVYIIANILHMLLLLIISRCHLYKGMYFEIICSYAVFYLMVK